MVWRGDITRLAADAVVNAANEAFQTAHVDLASAVSVDRREEAASSQCIGVARSKNRKVV